MKSSVSLKHEVQEIFDSGAPCSSGREMKIYYSLHHGVSHKARHPPPTERVSLEVAELSYMEFAHSAIITD